MVKLCYFFLPDPWNYSEDAFPRSLYDYLYLPKYYSKNYTAVSKIKIIYGILRLSIFFLNPFLIIRLIKNITKIIKYLIIDGINNNNLFSLYDLISTEVFIHFTKKTKPDVALIFLNSLAHYQHHHWDNNTINLKGKINLEIIDLILGKLLKLIDKKETLIILNGLSQKNVKSNGYCIYKLRSTKNFLDDFKIKYLKIEQYMTNDGHIKFDSINDLNKAKNILDSFLIKNKKLFFTEIISSEKYFILFWQLDFYEKIVKNQSFSIFNNQYNFNKYFVLLAERSGSHIPNGEIIHRNFNLPKSIKNNLFFDYLLEHFK